MNLASSCHLSLLLLLVNLTGLNGNRIIGGAEVYPYSIKYQASLRSHLIQVVLSEHSINTVDGFEQIFNVSLVFRHYKYQHWTFDNDIMLLKLDRPATINARVEPAHLPDPDSPPLTGRTLCTVSGWGVTWLNSYSLSSVLRSVDVDIFPNCWYYYYFRITENMICAGSVLGGKDSCQVRNKAI
ncbi:hypothetical protein PAMP_017146 [Pampus punctatissimus]